LRIRQADCGLVVNSRNEVWRGCLLDDCGWDAKVPRKLHNLGLVEPHDGHDVGGRVHAVLDKEPDPVLGLVGRSDDQPVLQFRVQV